MTETPKLTVRSLDVRAVNAPLARPVRTASGSIDTAPLVLVDVTTNEGVIGRSYVFCYTPVALAPVARVVQNLEALIKGDRVAPVDIAAKLEQRFRLVGPQGLIGIGAAALDMALWDALARAAGKPLVELLGGTARPLRTYDSYGMAPVRDVDELASASLSAGFRAMKIKVGFENSADDVAAIREVRKATGDAMTLMVDYNQSLSLAEALRRTRMLDEEGLAWIEEPLRADDDAGHAQLAVAMRTPLQLGENWWGVNDMTRSIVAKASRLAMPDVMKIGGVTGWMRASALAQAAGLPVSSHIFPEISAHLLAVTPTADWLEYLDFAGTLLRDPVRPEDGFVTAPAKPGVGLEWDERAVKRYAAQ
ncbi:MAG TPA: enolase C-terminal domain-like protein [Casimicrobiaceae bacterium]|nr:enolase C-terminal domain-like protein [Casimicrobiaceae bacterium]